MSRLKTEIKCDVRHGTSRLPKYSMEILDVINIMPISGNVIYEHIVRVSLMITSAVVATRVTLAN